MGAQYAANDPLASPDSVAPMQTRRFSPTVGAHGMPFPRNRPGICEVLSTREQ